jgi:hypothetical protein
MNDAVTHLAGDLFDAGIEPRRRSVLMLLYDRALNARSPESWRRFYQALFSALRRLANRSSAPTWRSYFALRSLLRILEDDLGSVLFSARAAARLRASLDALHGAAWQDSPARVEVLHRAGLGAIGSARGDRAGNRHSYRRRVGIPTDKTLTSTARG